MNEKPMIIARQEYIQMLCDVTNNAKLPAFIKADVVERLFNELQKLSQTELENAVREYETEMGHIKNNEECMEHPRTFSKEVQIPVDENFKQIGPPVVLDTPLVNDDV